jgi:hypothetical protein
MNKPAATTNVEPPVAGKRHTSIANITNSLRQTQTQFRP